MNTIFIDSQSRLWIGGNGVYVIDLENSRNTYECIYYQHKLDDPESKINEKITCIFETKKGRFIWVASEMASTCWKTTVTTKIYLQELCRALRSFGHQHLEHSGR